MLSSYLKLPICLFLWVWYLIFLRKIEYIKILQYFLSRSGLSLESNCTRSKIKYIKILQFLSRSDLSPESNCAGPIKIMTCVKIQMNPMQLDTELKPNHFLIGLPTNQSQNKSLRPILMLKFFRILLIDVLRVFVNEL